MNDVMCFFGVSMFRRN